MSRSTNRIVAAAALMLCAGVALAQGSGSASLGRAATPAEIRAWDIDVRPDFQGLPKGSGTVAQGQEVWESRCASCHGTFGESSEVFGPLTGGTTAEDMKRGRSATLASPHPLRSTLSKVATLSTLWDYIHRAMPWNAPKSLSNDEVYSVLAYLLNLGEILPADATLSSDNIAEVQKTMPNRNGMTRAHGLWDTRGKPDTHNVACMKNCEAEVRVTSTLPLEARDAHGDLSQQNRPYGAIRGAQTMLPPGTRPAGGADPARSAGSKPSLQSLASQSGCMACHGVTNKIVGPAFQDVAAKYKGDAAAQARLLAKVKVGGSGEWGAIPMPPQSQVREDDLNALVRWVLAGAK